MDNEQMSQATTANSAAAQTEPAAVKKPSKQEMDRQFNNVVKDLDSWKKQKEDKENPRIVAILPPFGSRFPSTTTAKEQIFIVYGYNGASMYVNLAY